MISQVIVDGKRVVLEFDDPEKLSEILNLLKLFGGNLSVERRDVVIRYDEKFWDYLLKDRQLDERTARDYMRYLRKLDGKVINYDLYLEVSGSRWVVKTIRLYLDYLYKLGRISSDELGKLKGIFKVKNSKEVKWYEVDPDELVSRVLFVREGSLYRLILELLLYSGVRLSEVIRMVKTWDRSKLICFEDRGFCRYGLMWRRGRKRCDWVYIPCLLVSKIEEILSKKGRIGDYDTIRKDIYEYYKIKEKDFRKLFYRICRETTDKEVCDFIQSRISGLSISDIHYDNLLARADSEYPRIVARIGEIIESILCSMSGAC